MCSNNGKEESLTKKAHLGEIRARRSEVEKKKLGSDKFKCSLRRDSHAQAPNYANTLGKDKKVPTPCHTTRSVHALNSHYTKQHNSDTRSISTRMSFGMIKRSEKVTWGRYNYGLAGEVPAAICCDEEEGGAGG